MGRGRERQVRERGDGDIYAVFRSVQRRVCAAENGLKPERSATNDAY